MSPSHSRPLHAAAYPHQPAPELHSGGRGGVSNQLLYSSEQVVSSGLGLTHILLPPNKNNGKSLTAVCPKLWS